MASSSTSPPLKKQRTDTGDEVINLTQAAGAEADLGGFHLYEFKNILFEVAKITRLPNQVRETNVVHDQVRFWIDQFKRKIYGKCGDYISVSTAGLFEKVGDVNALVACDHKGALLTDKVRVILADGFHRLAALKHPDVAAVAPVVLARWFLRTDGKDTNMDEILSIGHLQICDRSR